MAVATGFEGGKPRPLPAGELPPRVRRVLGNLQRIISSELERQLHVVLHEAEVELSRALERARGGQSELVRGEALRSLRQLAPQLIAGFLHELEEGLSNLHAARSSRNLAGLSPPGQGLSLLDDTEMTEGAVLDDIATRSDSRNSLALQLMGQRFGVLAGAPAFDAEHLPVGPHALCHALRNAAANVALPMEVRLALYRQLDRVAMAHYPGLLEALNARLAADGILPHLSFVPVRLRPAQRDPAREATAPVRAVATAVPPTVTPTLLPAPSGDGFAGLQDLLARRRLLLAKLRSGGSDERVRQALGGEEVLAALRRLRASPTKNCGSPGDIRQTLLAQARQLHGHGVTLADADSDVFELFGLMLGHLQRELDSHSAGVALVERLTLPLLQLALRDRRFFADSTHPARMLLDAVSLAGARWLAADDLDAQWLGLLQRAVATVEDDPDASAETFVAANHALQDGLQAAARRYEMAERRQVEAARGREKLALARHRASREIAQLVAGCQLPRFHHMLLEQAWTDVLALALLRNGEASEAWRTACETTRAIIDAIGANGEQAADPGLLAKVEDALGHVGYHAEDASAIARQLANGRAEAADLASRTELGVQLKARARLGQDQLAGAGSHLPSRTAAQQAAFARLGATSDGCWIELHDDAHDRVVRRRLAWTSARSGHALLLNRRSLRVDGDDLDGLARRLVAGEVGIVEEDYYPAEAAWQATLGNLHRIAGNPVGEEADHEP